MSIEVRNLNKRFGQTVVCDNLNLDIPDGELVALLGPSGSGKTSLLRIIAGAGGARQRHGAVPRPGRHPQPMCVTARSASSSSTTPLFPQMTIFENVAFGLRVRPKATRAVGW